MVINGYKCPYCELVGKSRKSIIKHIEEVHKDG